MTEISAFVGHSFLETDAEVVRKFLDYFTTITQMSIGFTWDHAEQAEAKTLSQKVLEKMNGKTLFIGICTAREQVVEPGKLKPVPSKAHFVMMRQNELSWKTSDWILQEIGCAFGKGMKIMILLENGVRKPGGLQGDVEYIPFDRNRLDEPFGKILQMLQSLMPKASYDGAQASKLVEPKKDSASARIAKVARSEPQMDWTFDQFNEALVSSIIDGDEDNENQLSAKYLQTSEAQDESKQVIWRALRLYYHNQVKKEDTLNQLTELSKKHPSNDDVLYLLGSLYESYKQYGKAADHYTQSALNSVSDSKKLSRLCTAAIAFSKDGDYLKSESLLGEAEEVVKSAKDGNITILDARATISDIQHADDNFLAFSEGLLDKQPDNHECRFSLAYRASELGESDLAVYHYRILAEKKPSEGRWNNLGVSLANLGLVAKAVDAYRESEKLGGTLAMSNLAYKLLNAGFLNEAKEICDNATKIENYDNRVGAAISRIGEVAKEEEKKESETLEATKNRRLFYIAYGNACIKPVRLDFQGVLKGSDCDLTVTIKDSKMEAKGSFERKFSITGWLPPGSSPSDPKPITVVTHVRYVGDVLGHGIKYRHWAYESKAG